MVIKRKSVPKSNFKGLNIVSISEMKIPKDFKKSFYNKELKKLK